MVQPIVKCDQLTKRYGKKYALDHFDLAIPAGRIVGVLGPNGCGKSTLFRAITGLITPDEGEIRVLGQSPGWQTNRFIGYLPDRARWYPRHTVLQAFEWGASFLPGFDLEAAKKFARYMDVDLEMSLSGMSKGQEARVMLILCMSREVPLIILDEPFAGIDLISREAIIAGIDLISREAIIAGMIDYLEEREVSILISTHDIQEVEGLFDYIVLMDQGKAIWSGEADELRAQYGSLHDVFRTFYKREWSR
ncbi:ABC transporter ATP-binding protein [Brevibacillus reuszeri]|nr:ABC transporter ATP-binding protein [Brevibacillus reuszeri]KNB72984.1 multidrug ABC transporter ATPase [Brevibacillus reuszeri]MED1855856.1 ABC transporter ATP-binding protein [Brevibacillus reuszeri]